MTARADVCENDLFILCHARIDCGAAPVCTIMIYYVTPVLTSCRLIGSEI